MDGTTVYCEPGTVYADPEMEVQEVGDIRRELKRLERAIDGVHMAVSILGDKIRPVSISIVKQAKGEKADVSDAPLTIVGRDIRKLTLRLEEVEEWVREMTKIISI